MRIIPIRLILGFALLFLVIVLITLDSLQVPSRIVDKDTLTLIVMMTLCFSTLIFALSFENKEN